MRDAKTPRRAPGTRRSRRPDFISVPNNLLPFAYKLTLATLPKARVVFSLPLSLASRCARKHTRVFPQPPFFRFVSQCDTLTASSAAFKRNKFRSPRHADVKRGKTSVVIFGRDVSYRFPTAILTPTRPKSWRVGKKYRAIVARARASFPPSSSISSLDSLAFPFRVSPRFHYRRMPRAPAENRSLIGTEGIAIGILRPSLARLQP